MPNSAWGIDLGNRALKAIKLVREDGQIRVDDFEVIEHDQILSIAGDNKESLLQTALANFVERHNAKGSVVGVSVSGQQSFARFIKLPPVEPKKIPEIVKFEAIQQIPFPLDDVEWSYQLFQDKDSPDVEVGIFAMKKELVNRQINYFTSLGLNVQTVQMHPLAVYNGMYYDDRVGQTTMFMDSGAENTDLIIADGQTVWLRTLPIGGNNFTETLAKSFKLSFAKAEELKRNAASSKYAKQIFQAMRPVFADLVAEIQRSIGFYASVHRDARIQRIMALGSTFQLPGLQKYLQQNLQLPVEKLDSFKALPPQDPKMAANYSENLISLAGAYGLALQALGEAQITASLLPESIRRAKMWQEKTKWFGAAAALFVIGSLGVAGSYYYQNFLYEKNAPTRDAIKTTLSTASTLRDEWKSKIENAGTEERTRLVNLKAVQGGRDLWPTLLHDLMNSVPPADPEKLRSVPRPQREQVVIKSIQSAYMPDLAELLAPTADLRRFVTGAQPGSGTGTGAATGGIVPGPYGAGGADPRYSNPLISRFGRPGTYAPAVPVPTDPTATPGDTRRGFLLTIRGHTPNRAGGEYVGTHFLKALLAKTEEAQLKAGMPYFIAKADIVETGPRIRKDLDAENNTTTTPRVTPTPLTPPTYTPRPGATGRPGYGGNYGATGYGGPRGDYFRTPTVPRAYGGGGYGGGRFTSPLAGGGSTPGGILDDSDPMGEEGVIGLEVRDPTTGAAVSTEPVDPMQDRIFRNEKMDGDTAFTAVIVVVLEPKPPTVAPPAESTDTSAAAQ